MKNNCYIVIGSSGFIGNSLCKKIKNKNNLFTISRKKRGNLSFGFHTKLDMRNFKLVNNYFKKLKKEYRKIYIFFLAGDSTVESTNSNPEKMVSNSINSFHNLLLSLKDTNSTIVYASTGAVYDSRKKGVFTEKDPLFPPSPYAAAKYSSEGLCMSYHETFGLDVRIARIFSVFGENMKRFFIYDIIHKIHSSNLKIELNGNGLQVRDYLHVDDVVNGLVLIASKGKPGEIYNISSGKPTKLNDLANKIKKILNKEKLMINWNNRITKGVRDHWYGDNTKISKLGFKIKKDIRDNLEHTVKKIFSNLK
tara:strand:+ start:720 stop:1643 length:924 start_codon:yes stop_codon:yes gene_type:complete